MIHCHIRHVVYCDVAYYIFAVPVSVETMRWSNEDENRFVMCTLLVN